MTDDEKLRTVLEIPTPWTQQAFQLEQYDAEWADLGQMVYGRLMNKRKLTDALMRASMKSATADEMARQIQIYLLTGARP